MPGERVLGPDERLDRARELAWAALDRREHTVAEMRRRLESKRVDAETAGAILTELVGGGWLDDEAFARRFAEDRRELDGWGSERIARRLNELGVDAEHVEAAVGERSRDDEFEAALELLRRRFPTPPETLREAQRALALLVRRGYDLELAHDALRRHANLAAQD